MTKHFKSLTFLIILSLSLFACGENSSLYDSDVEFNDARLVDCAEFLAADAAAQDVMLKQAALEGFNLLRDCSPTPAPPPEGPADFHFHQINNDIGSKTQCRYEFQWDAIEFWPGSYVPIDHYVVRYKINDDYTIENTTTDLYVRQSLITGDGDLDYMDAQVKAVAADGRRTQFTDNIRVSCSENMDLPLLPAPENFSHYIDFSMNGSMTVCDITVSWDRPDLSYFIDDYKVMWKSDAMADWAEMLTDDMFFSRVLYLKEGQTAFVDFKVSAIFNDGADGVESASTPIKRVNCIQF